MERYVCIHGHFYQPPRENAWLEAVEAQDSAYPYHDWNERITAECYGPNAYARILDDQGRIIKLVNNYARISFNFGPTLLSWMQARTPDVYRAILQADRDSQERFSGHGSAMAQVYNHIIMPLANARDKRTQILWGVRDFESRYERRPEGMWLAETAVDLESLDIMAEQGVRFTVLSPYQAKAYRSLEGGDWIDATGGRIDPSRAYLQKLPSGRSIALFFYDGPISQAVAFERLLSQGSHLVNRLLGGFVGDRQWPQLVHIATDGESYGHHHGHGDMALAYALRQIEDDPSVRLTNYGEYLEKHPPTQEAQVIENSSWSCIHGIERWRSNCGCNSGRQGWNQLWRAPLREALDWLRDHANKPFEEMAGDYFRDPWEARNDYVNVIMDRSAENVERFFHDQVTQELTAEDRPRVLMLMELQRQLMLMYTSCGWFFDDLSGIETVQVIQYACRALQLAEELFGNSLEEGFLERLEQAKSNIPEHGDGRAIYQKMVKPAKITWHRIAAHYAVTTLFEMYPEKARIYCYTADREDFQAFEAGKAKLVVGKARITSEVTSATSLLTFGVLNFGDHNVHGGVRDFGSEQEYLELVELLDTAFAKADFAEIIRLMDRGFGDSTYSLESLFRDEQRRFTKKVLYPTVQDAEATYRRLFEQHLPTMRFLANMEVPLPSVFQSTAEFLINADLHAAIQQDEPDVEEIHKLLKEAAEWGVHLDQAGLAYDFKKSLSRLAERFRHDPTDFELAARLEAVVDRAGSLPFEVDLWQTQNFFFDVERSVFPEMLQKASEGDDEARAWLDHFLRLGQKLNILVEDSKKKIADVKKAPTVQEVFQELIAKRHVPRATYRFQFNKSFTFVQAAALVPYLHRLGISDCYASPILQARPGSPHGYDICNHSRLNSELGGEEGFQILSNALREHGMGLIVDIVPNHMGIGHPSNLWWYDVLENGPSSVYAPYFDIDWDPVNPGLYQKVLLPILGDQYGNVLENGELKLVFDEGAFLITYYEHQLPVSPSTYPRILSHYLDTLVKALGDEHESVSELSSILTALSYLPAQSEVSTEKVIERNREKEVIKRRIATLAASSPPVHDAIQSAVLAFNGRVGDASSFDLLDKLLEEQAYRVAYWRVSTEEINYRRFFDINDLAAIRVEKPIVFEETHELIFRLLAAAQVHGLRIDHPDGLWDPTGYFLRLQQDFLTHRIRQIIGAQRCPEGMEQEVASLLKQWHEDTIPAPGWPLYVVAEKILGEDEPLPPDWAVSGTTGYDFLNACGGLFVDADQSDQFESLYQRFTGLRPDFTEMVITSQKMIMHISMASELNALSHLLDRISEHNRRYRDFTLISLTFVLREIIACMLVYRTYINGPDKISMRDRMFIEESVAMAKKRNPRTAEAIFDFIRDTMLLRNLDSFRMEDRPAVIEWAMKVQQLTGPVLAKAMEDTSFYRYNRLVALNEVGGHPAQFGVEPESFHRQNATRLQRWPHAMLSSSTHDTKRSEDVRARLYVLSEMPEVWQETIERWSAQNLPNKKRVEGSLAPDANDEYLLYQTLIGAWPAEPMSPEGYAEFRERIQSYMTKATKEAKVHTSWVNANVEYDSAVREFTLALLGDERTDAFLLDLQAFQERIAYFGYFNSLSQTLMKLTAPGMPDVYQGTEMWDLSLVDPDNRRPVDYAPRQAYLEEICAAGQTSADRLAFIDGMLANITNGKIKLFLVHAVLEYRKQHDELFRDGSYVPVTLSPGMERHVCAYLRTLGDQTCLVVVPRLIYKLAQGQQLPPIGDIWKDAYLPLNADFGKGSFRNLLTDEVVEVEARPNGPSLRMAKVLSRFPVALLEPC